MGQKVTGFLTYATESLGTLKGFLEDFMFGLTKEESENWRSLFVTSKEDKRIAFLKGGGKCQLGEKRLKEKCRWQKL